MHKCARGLQRISRDLFLAVERCSSRDKEELAIPSIFWRCGEYLGSEVPAAKASTHGIEATD